MKRLLVFGALLGWCSALLVVRFMRSGSLQFGFLAWNLFLAAIPAIAAWLFVRASEHRFTSAQIAWFMLWLLFLPNAPYITTDFVHLRESLPIPLWYDIVLLGSCAGTGLLLGYTSVADVQAVFARRFSIVAGWAVACAALFLCGFGIYLGRFLRWNSWDALTHPKQLLSDIARRSLDPFSHPGILAVTAIYGVALVLGYTALRVLHTTTREARTVRQ
jgi:uncharacterized membrane protein